MVVGVGGEGNWMGDGLGLGRLVLGMHMYMCLFGEGEGAVPLEHRMNSEPCSRLFVFVGLIVLLG